MLLLNTHSYYRFINAYYFSLEGPSRQSLLIQYSSTQGIYFGDLYVKMCRSILFYLRLRNSPYYGCVLIYLHVCSLLDVSHVFSPQIFPMTSNANCPSEDTPLHVRGCIVIYDRFLEVEALSPF